MAPIKNIKPRINQLFDSNKEEHKTKPNTVVRNITSYYPLLRLLMVRELESPKLKIGVKALKDKVKSEE